jgi:hypothetical protein
MLQSIQAKRCLWIVELYQTADVLALFLFLSLYSKKFHLKFKIINFIYEKSLWIWIFLRSLKDYYLHDNTYFYLIWILFLMFIRSLIFTYKKVWFLNQDLITDSYTAALYILDKLNITFNFEIFLLSKICILILFIIWFCIIP